MAVLSMSKQEFTRLDVYRRNSVAPMRGQLRIRPKITHKRVRVAQSLVITTSWHFEPATKEMCDRVDAIEGSPGCPGMAPPTVPKSDMFSMR
jgi:hypothetical protein